MPIAQCPTDAGYGDASLYALYGGGYGPNDGGLLNTASSAVPNSYTINASQVIQPTRLILMAEQPVNNYLLQSWNSYSIANGLLIIHYIKPTRQHRPMECVVLRLPCRRADAQWRYHYSRPKRQCAAGPGDKRVDVGHQCRRDGLFAGQRLTGAAILRGDWALARNSDGVVPVTRRNSVAKCCEEL